MREYIDWPQDPKQWPVYIENGLSAEEIKEVILHCAIYAGVPAANAAFAIAQGVIAEQAEG